MRTIQTTVSLILCWITLIGNIGTWITGVALVATQASQMTTGVFLCAIAVSSFYCSLTLRKILSSTEFRSKQLS